MIRSLTTYFYYILIFFCVGMTSSFAKKIDGTLSFFIKEAGAEDVKNISKEFNKHFNKVEAFELAKNTDYYLYYIPIAGTDEVEFKEVDTSISTENYSKYLQSRNTNYKLDSNSNRPYSGSMYLYDSYGDVIFIIRNNDQYKTQKQALEKTAGLMKKRIDGETEKLLAQKTNRCLLCDFNTLADQQKTQVFEILFLTHQNILPKKYTIAGSEPVSLEPYAALYFTLADTKKLDHILDTDAVRFDHAMDYNDEQTHIINEAIRQKYPKQLISKIAGGYRHNNFKTVDASVLPPLFLATGYQDIDVMQELINYGADVNQKIAFGSLILTPLNISAQNGSIETTTLLIKNGAKLGYGLEENIFPWKIAMWMADYDHAALLWPKMPEDVQSPEAQNLLIEAVYHGQENLFNELLSKKIPVNSTDQNGANVILASIKGMRDFSAAVDPDDPNNTKHKVDEETYWRIIDQTKNAGLTSDIQTERDNQNRGALHYAYPEASAKLTDDHLRIISKLVEQGADPTMVDANDLTANEAYKTARLAYIDQQHKTRLEELAKIRIAAGQASQSREDRVKELALNVSKANEQYEKQKKVVLNLKRQSALNQAKQRALNQAYAWEVPTAEFSEFEREASDAQKQLNVYKDELDAANKAARETYVIDAREADAAYNASIDKETASFEQQKNDELERIEQIQKSKQSDN